MPPLYKVQFTGAKEPIYCYTNEELREITEGKTNYTLQRYKGLGEMSAEALRETTMDPKTRSIIKVNIQDDMLAEKRVSVLMGDKVEPRKAWINENVDFTLEDDFKKKN
jgi:topoisomerase-4 subunit B